MTNLSDLTFFSDYSNWVNEVKAAGKRYFLENAVYPNYLVASSATYDRIAAIARQHPEFCRLIDTHGFAHRADQVYQTDQTDEIFDGFLNAFQCALFSLDFATDETIPVDSYELFFDEFPEFDEEEIPEKEAL